jgi:hypothetical protein
VPVTIRVLSWNIYKFGTHLTGNTTRLNIVLDAISPAGGPSNYDLVVVIEPQIASGKIEALATGSGPKAMRKLRSALQTHTGEDWQVVPPVVLAASAKREAMAVFFNAGKLTLKGPVDDVKITDKAWRTAKTQGAGAGSLRGRCEFKDSGGTAVKFPTGPERRPYFVTFEASGQLFSIVGHHSPSPAYSGSTSSARNKQARQGTEALGEIAELQAPRAHPVIVVGDFNCCNPGHPAGGGYGCTTKAKDKDEEAEEGLTNIGFTSHVNTGSSLKGANVATAGGYTNHAFDYLLTADGGGKAVTVTNAKVLGLGSLTTGFAPTLKKNKFRPIFKRVRVTKGKGVSDHLPVAATITI